MAINWDGLNSSPNIFQLGMQGYEAGRKMRSDREVRQASNMFAQDPDKGTDALIAAGRPDLAAASTSARRSQRVARAERDASTYAASGDYAGAARAAAPSDIETAKNFAQFDDSRMDHLQKSGERSARIIMSAAALPTAEDRRAYIGQHADELSGMGYKPDQIASYDTTDPIKMRADAARFMSLSEIAGKRDVEKLGDFAVTYESDPIRGTRAVGKTAIPPTRKETQDAAEFQYRKEHDGKELSLREKEFQLKSFISENPDSSPAKVVGPIFRKLANGQPLTSGEQEALRYYKLDPITAGAMGEDAGDEELGGRPPPRPAPGRAPPKASAVPPAPRAPQARKANTVYQTPQGPMTWTGTGWLPAN